MKLTKHDQCPDADARSAALCVTITSYLAAGRAKAEILEPPAVRDRVVQDPLGALRERLAVAS